MIFGYSPLRCVELWIWHLVFSFSLYFFFCVLNKNEKSSIFRKWDRIQCFGFENFHHWLNVCRLLFRIIHGKMLDYTHREYGFLAFFVFKLLPGQKGVWTNMYSTCVDRIWVNMKEMNIMLVWVSSDQKFTIPIKFTLDMNKKNLGQKFPYPKKILLFLVKVQLADWLTVCLLFLRKQKTKIKTKTK